MNDRRLPPARREYIYSYPDEPTRFSECPQCSKQTLYQRNADKFVCLSCSFQRDLSKPKEKSFLPTLLMLLTLIVLVLFILAA
ncbi:hypothetical protein [Leptolyngbya sp. FACHB-711]|jgi:hypothetical protein|uniref:hypothetical protein n=1 Tax=unclassified Leptolyngbya TaxID=2650499 RepID=UPI001689C98C|nr:hypothetical protein [Leptolyngbya sp. FACHB-711]MBD1849266.1 hypothetical protein [Cyanobacteria bacterium FACHB-502]MBD2026818.1 hypothetical protein [Leptolyngbya sp. FACHB-711]